MLRIIILTVLVLVILGPACYATVPQSVISEEAIQKIKSEPGQSWLKGLEESRARFAEKYGTSFAFIFYYDQQLILAAKHDKGKGRGLCYWNLELIQQLWPGGSITGEMEIDRGRGVDKYLPTFSGFDTNSGENLDLYVPELYLQQNFSRDKVYLAAGKLDLSDWFDDSAVAASGDTQFVSDSLINNLTIPFPSKGLGALATFKLYDWLYFQPGAATAKAVSSKTGLSNGFNSTLFLAEVGLTPKFGKLQGNYRFIYHLTHEKLDFIDESRTKNNTAGFALSFDQAFTERLTLFMRYGFANAKVNSIAYFWSAGGQITEPLPGRKYDCLGIAVAESILGKDYRDYNGENTAYSETFWELYYSWDLNHIFTITPHLQIVSNPNADKSASTEVVAGVRLLCLF